MPMILPRAARLPLPLSVFYRHPQDDFWFSSQAVNVSETGILFGPADLTSGARVEVMLSPPVPVGTLATGPQVFAGEVVRTTATGAAAVRFQESWFLLDA
jgi:PilZ domain